MKNLFKYSLLAAILACMTGITACNNEELDTDQYAGKLALAAISPNPVMRGGELRFIGANLEKVAEVRFTGGATVSSIQTIASGDRSEIRITVPYDGTEVGPVTVVTSDGLTASTKFDLEYTEPIVFTSFSPSEALSGDVITITGEYLNNVQEVVLGGEVRVTEFQSQSRTQISFIVPANAVTGYVIVGDVNELQDQNTIPNLIYSPEELTIGDPTVNVADDATYKRGETITVSGSHLDMIEKVDLVGASDVEFSVASDGSSISFTLPASATDGAITLTSYAGNTFEAGNITTVSVADLGISSLAEDERYKAGGNVLITGEDLDLVTKVEFTGAEASWYNTSNGIVASIPAGAQDGSLTLTLGSGKQAWTDAIEVVKPVAESVSATEAVAGQTESIFVAGTDLDLVTSVTIGDKTNSFIDCPFTIISADSIGVAIPKAAYTGILTLTAASGYATETQAITITYDESISVTFDQASYSLGKPISISGENLMNVESIYIKGNKVTSYSLRTNNAMNFAMPEDLKSPGVYRLVFTLMDGTELTWPVPFEVTAPYTETFIWEGYEDLAGWSNSPYFGSEDAFINAGLEVGDLVRVYYDVLNPDWWQFQLHDGHWGNISVEELGWDITVSKNNTEEGAKYFAFTVTDAIYAQLTAIQWWGGAFLTNGEGVAITGISMIHFGATETVVWEGPSTHTGDYGVNLELGGEDDWVNAELYEGAEVRVYFTPDDPSDWSIQLFDGHWGGMGYVTPNGVQFNQDNDPDAPSRGYISFIAEGAAYQAMTSHQWWGYALIVQGKNLVVTKLAYL